MNLNEKRIDISIKSNFAVRTEMHHCRKTKFLQMNLHHDLTRRQSNAKYFYLFIQNTDFVGNSCNNCPSPDE
jgi:hypothetical protein